MKILLVDDTVVEVVDKAFSTDSFSSYCEGIVKAPVEPVMLGRLNVSGAEGFLYAWMDEIANLRDPSPPTNTVVTGLSYCLGRNYNLRGVAVITFEYPEKRADVPQEILDLVEAIAKVHRMMGIRG